MVEGKKCGTFFSPTKESGTPVEVQALNARDGGRQLQALKPEQRADIINAIATQLSERQHDILNANKKDLDEARATGEAVV